MTNMRDMAFIQDDDAVRLPRDTRVHVTGTGEFDTTWGDLLDTNDDLEDAEAQLLAARKATIGGGAQPVVELSVVEG